MDRLTALEAFVAVADTGSFTRAGLRLRISTAMVTLHVRRLEAHLGVGLFNRTTRRVDLTEDGRQFLAYAKAALEAFVVAEQSTRSGGGMSGRVRLDVPASVGHAFVVPALADFRNRHPNITLDLSLGDRGTVFRLDGFDIVLRTGGGPVSGWQMARLGHTRLLCLASSAYLARHGVPANPDDLAAHRCILYASVESPGGNPWLLRNGAPMIRARPPAAFTFNDGAAIMAAARAGLGICQNLAMLAQDDLREGRLVEVLADFCRVPLALAMMSARDRIALPHVRAVRDFLIERIDWRLEAA